MSTDQIGLARLPEGTELVRIGRPQRPEFAAWRYGDQFGRRRRRAIILGTAGAVAVGGIVVGGAIVGASLGGGGYGWINFIQIIQQQRTISRITTRDGTPIRVRGRHLGKTRLVPIGDDRWNLELRASPGWKRTVSAKNDLELTLTDEEAIQIAGRIMARVNRTGGSRKEIQRAVGRIEEAGDPRVYLREAALESDRLRLAKAKGNPKKFEKVTAGSFRQLPRAARLALEMATQEETERQAMEGELKMLEAAWREAEEVAAIADDLLVPAGIREFIRKHRPT